MEKRYIESAHDAQEFQLDLEEAELHAELLARVKRPKILIVMKDDDKERFARDRKALRDHQKAGKRGYPKMEGPHIEARSGTLHSLADWIEDKQREGAGAFVLVHENDGTKHHTRKNIVAARACWHEDDTPRKQPLDFPLPASFDVQSSKGKFHSYWLFKHAGELSLDEADGINQCLADDYDGDGSAKDRARILRLAGSWNLKPGPDPWQAFIHAEKKVPYYSAAELIEAFPPVAKESKHRRASRPINPDAKLPDDADIVLSALAALPIEICEEYDSWLKIGMALHDWSSGSLDGLAVWEDWSMQASNFGECDDKWSSFSGVTAGVTLGTLFHEAKTAGWSQAAAEQAASRRSLAKLGEMLATREDGQETSAKPKEPDGPNWATDTHAAVKAALRELAITGAEQNGPIEFTRLLEQIGSKAASYGLDLHRKMPGKRVTLLEAELRAVKAAIKEDATNERADSGVAFPDTDSRDGLPRKDSVPNVVAWLEHYEHDIWFDEFADEVKHGKKLMDDSRMLALRKDMHEDQFLAGTPLVNDGIHAMAHEKRRHQIGRAPGRSCPS